jgi:hypothetical protein
MQRDCVALTNGLVDENNNINGEEDGDHQDDFEASKWL